MSDQRQRPKKLNGWVRMWLLAALIWLVVVVALKKDGYPTEVNLRNDFTEQSNEASRELIAKANAGSEECLEQYKKAPNDFPIAKCMLDSRPAYKWFAEGAKREKDRIQESGETFIQEHLPSLQRDYLAMSALLWGVPVVVLFILGYAIAWVIRGFRTSPD